MIDPPQHDHGHAHGQPGDDAGDGHDHGELFPRQLTAGLVAEAEATAERRALGPVLAVAAGLVLLALGLPNERLPRLPMSSWPAAWDSPLWASPAPLSNALVRAASALGGVSLERIWYLFAALTFAACLPALVALLRGVGFGARTSLLAAVCALASPLAWDGATRPGPFPAGVLVATWLAALLFRHGRERPARSSWGVSLAWGIAVLIHPDMWLAWPVIAATQIGEGRTLTTAFWVALPLVILCGLAPGVSWQVPSPGTLAPRGVHAARLALSTGASLVGLFGLMAGRRAAEESAPPFWTKLWFGALLLPLAMGHAPGGFEGTWLVPLAALGLADLATRHAREERAHGLLAGLLVVGVLSCVGARLALGGPDAPWRATARARLEPGDVVFSAQPAHLYLLEQRYGLVAIDLRSPAETAAGLTAWASAGRRLVLDAGGPVDPAARALVEKHAGDSLLRLNEHGLE